MLAVSEAAAHSVYGLSAKLGEPQTSAGATASGSAY
jgi:hypothetical protein